LLSPVVMLLVRLAGRVERVERALLIAPTVGLEHRVRPRLEVAVAAAQVVLTVRAATALQTEQAVLVAVVDQMAAQTARQDQEPQAVTVAMAKAELAVVQAVPQP